MLYFTVLYAILCPIELYDILYCTCTMGMLRTQCATFRSHCVFRLCGCPAPVARCSTVGLTSCPRRSG